MIVAAFGTSLTARGGWHGALRDALADTLGKPVEIHLVARPGGTTRWAAAHVQDVVALRPDVVLIEFAVNDAALYRGISVSRSRRAIGEVLTGLAARLPFSTLFLMAMSPAHGLRRLLRPRLNAYVEAHRKAALAAGAGFIDHRPAWRTLSMRDRRRAMPDGLHPSPGMAMAVMVQTIRRHIVDRLSQQEYPNIAR
jgi:lysophospholipase L1-like esterase